MNHAMIAKAAGQLRQALVEMKKSENWKLIVDPRDAVFARFQPIFQPAAGEVVLHHCSFPRRLGGKK